MNVWSQICAQSVGLALAPAWACLERQGFLGLLAEQKSWRLAELVEKGGAQLGPMSVVMRALDCEGLIWRESIERAETTVLGLTASGHELMTLPHPRAWVERLQACPEEQREGEFFSHSQARWELPESPLGARWANFLDAFVAVRPVLTLRRAGQLDSPMLRAMGWVDEAGQRTEKGRKASKLDYTYLFLWSYTPLIASLDDLLFGTTSVFEREEGAEEGHISREADISFSGTLSADVCAVCAYPGLSRIFDSEGEQPQFMADMGCGDGRLLATLGRYVAEKTRRGESLDEDPLWLVGVDQEAVSRRSAEVTLSQTGLRALVLPGDISEPDALSEELRKAGLDPLRGLHMSKSVLHDRTYKTPRDQRRAAQRQARSTAAFLDPDSRALDNALLEQDLVETLASWGPYARRHGMLLIEAHTAEPEVIRENLHRNWSPGFDLLQGLSHQYATELPVLHEALREAGYNIDSWVDPTRGFCGFPVMSLNWLSWSP